MYMHRPRYGVILYKSKVNFGVIECIFHRVMTSFCHYSAIFHPPLFRHDYVYYSAMTMSIIQTYSTIILL